MPKPPGTTLRIVAHANNLSTEERQWVDDICEKLHLSLRDIAGLCFVDEDRMLVLQLRDGRTKVEDLSKYKQEKE